MASPAEIIERHDRRAVMEALAKAQSDGIPPPDGFYLADKRLRPVWLAPGVTPESLGLTTFQPTSRWTS